MDNYIKPNVKLKATDDFLDISHYNSIQNLLKMLEGIGYRNPNPKRSCISDFSFAIPEKFTQNKYSTEIYLESVDKSISSYLELVNIQMTKAFTQLGYSESFLKECRAERIYKNVQEYVKTVDKNNYYKIKESCMKDAKDLLPNICEEINNILS